MRESRVIGVYDALYARQVASSLDRRSTEPSAVAPGQLQLSRPMMSVTGRYRARFWAYSAPCLSGTNADWAFKRRCGRDIPRSVLADFPDSGATVKGKVVQLRFDAVFGFPPFVVPPDVALEQQTERFDGIPLRHRTRCHVIDDPVFPYL